MTDTCLCVFTTPRRLRLLCSVGCSRNRRSSFAQFNLSVLCDWKQLPAMCSALLHPFCFCDSICCFTLEKYTTQMTWHRVQTSASSTVFIWKTLTCKRRNHNCAGSLQFLSSQREKSIRGRTQKAISTATAEGNGTKCNSGTRQFEKRRKRVKQEITEGDENEYSERLN